MTSRNGCSQHYFAYLYINCNVLDIVWKTVHSGGICNSLPRNFVVNGFINTEFFGGLGPTMSG